MDLSSVWSLFSLCSGILVLISLLIYLLPLIYIRYLAPTQNLKTRYETEWALVTGASSGIGRAITIKLAIQGLNVILVALDDDKLIETMSMLKSEFPMSEFRAVGVDLSQSEPWGGDGYMKRIEEAMRDVSVGVICLNAGFLLMGYFDQIDIERHGKVVNCNANASICIAHYCYGKMISNGCKGCLLFTSSSAWLLPSPFAIMYGATKALVSSFGVSLAIEAEKYGVDVCVVHPCYTRTGLYDGAPKVAVLDLLDKFAWTSEQVAEVMLKAVGRVVSVDLGWYSIMSRLVNNLVDMGFLAKVFIPFRDSMAPKETPQAKKAL